LVSVVSSPWPWYVVPFAPADGFSVELSFREHPIRRLSLRDHTAITKYSTMKTKTVQLTSSEKGKPTSRVRANKTLSSGLAYIWRELSVAALVAVTNNHPDYLKRFLENALETRLLTLCNAIYLIHVRR